MKNLSLAVIVLFSLVAGPVFADEEKRFDVPIGDSPVLGPSIAAVTIIEFIDFQ